MIVPMVLAPLAASDPRRGRDAVRAVRARQDAALARALAFAGVSADQLPRDADGAPRPLVAGAGRRYWWSAANTRGAALGALAEARIGVDLEARDRPRVAPLDAFCDAAELALCAGRARALGAEGSRALALALWCAKEAVLKLTGAGIAELRACRLASAPDQDPEEIVLEHRGTTRAVRIERVAGFVCALACDARWFAPALEVLDPAAAAAGGPR